MPRVEIAGLPKGYWVGKSHDGKKWILTLPNQDGIYLLAEWNHQPSLSQLPRPKDGACEILQAKRDQQVKQETTVAKISNGRLKAVEPAFRGRKRDIEDAALILNQSAGQSGRAVEYS